MNAPTGPDSCYALAARKKARYLTRLYDNSLAPSGLSVSQFSILSLLALNGKLKLAALADLLIMERTSLVRALKPLQTAGYIVTERADGARAFDVLLSASGLAKVREAAPLWHAAQAEFERQVGQECAARQRDEVLDLHLAG
jgi:DNA-binding MarR family transcriptional regulator